MHRSNLFIYCCVLPTVVFLANEGRPCEQRSEAGKERAAREYFAEKGVLLKQWVRHGDAQDWLDGEEIYLSDKRFSDACVEYVLDVPDIRCVHLNRASITDDGVRRLAGKANLIQVDLGLTSVSDIGIKHLAALCQLRFLSLNSTKITDKSIEALGQLPNLEQLNIRDNPGISTLALDRRFAALRTIETRGCPLREVSLNGLASLEKMELTALGTVLERVRLENLPSLVEAHVTWFSPVVAEVPAEQECRVLLKALPKLHELTIQARIRGEDLKAIRAMPRLTSLELGQSQIVGAFSEHLRGLEQLGELDLMETHLDKNDLGFLGTLTNLRLLRLGYCDIDGTALRYVGGLKRLQELDFADNGPITNEQLAHLSRLESLRSLDLYHCGIAGDMLRHLAGLRKLESLSLQENAAIRDGDLRHLGALKELRSLNLRGCNIMGEGLHNLTGLKTLAEIDLTDNPLTRNKNYLKFLQELPPTTRVIPGRIRDGR